MKSFSHSIQFLQLCCGDCFFNITTPTWRCKTIPVEEFDSSTVYMKGRNVCICRSCSAQKTKQNMHLCQRTHFTQSVDRCLLSCGNEMDICGSHDPFFQHRLSSQGSLRFRDSSAPRTHHANQPLTATPTMTSEARGDTGRGGACTPRRRRFGRRNVLFWVHHVTIA